MSLYTPLMTDGFRLTLNISDLDRQRLDQKAAWAKTIAQDSAPNPLPSDFVPSEKDITTKVVDTDTGNAFWVKPQACGLECYCDAEVVSVRWARSDKQLAHVLNQRMDRIYSRIGDGDIECAGKHIGWATAALSMGREWTTGLDYLRPWSTHKAKNGDMRGASYIKNWQEFRTRFDGYGLDPIPEERYGDRLTVIGEAAFIEWTDEHYARQEKWLSETWAKITKTRDQIGTARFIDVMLLTRYAWIYKSYLEDEQREAQR